MATARDSLAPPDVPGSGRTSRPPSAAWAGRRTRRCVEALEQTGGHARLTYDRGDMEIMSLSPEHEDFKVGFRMAVEAAAESEGTSVRVPGVDDLPERGTGSRIGTGRMLLFRSLAGDRSENNGWTPNVDPPPDLAIEIDVTRSSIDRQGVYSARSESPKSGGSTANGCRSSCPGGRDVQDRRSKLQPSPNCLQRRLSG